MIFLTPDGLKGAVNAALRDPSEWERLASNSDLRALIKAELCRVIESIKSQDTIRLAAAQRDNAAVATGEMSEAQARANARDRARWALGAAAVRGKAKDRLAELEARPRLQRVATTRYACKSLAAAVADHKAGKIDNAGLYALLDSIRVPGDDLASADMTLAELAQRNNP